MWAKLRASTISKGEEMQGNTQSRSVNEEYLNAFRTNSYAEFFTKAQLLVSEHSNSSSYSYTQLSEILLEPGPETVAKFLESATFYKNADLKSLVLNYFDISAEASKICSHLLQSIKQTQSNYQFIQRALEIISDSSPDQFNYGISCLDSFNHLKNPFSNLSQKQFKLIHERYSSILHHLKSKRKKVKRKIKLIKYFKRGSQICITAACGMAAVAAIVLAVHTLSGLVLGPALFGVSPKYLKKKFSNFRFLRNGFLRKLVEQLDVAAKGTYILNRDFDTLSRLVVRLHDEIEHNKSIIRFCLERRGDRFPLEEVVKELRKSDLAFRKQVEELEEHVYLCLVTINRARVLVIKEMSTPCIGG
ncbi:UPF0496 protein At1g20180-like [Tasmannia lanceolata]|uniref:UPF0496 protein At1g20180-like n=1 Tax=Tasmannia lanceolata TaxID=3420 RepID=UPI0040641197